MDYITLTRETKRNEVGKAILALDTQTTNAMTQLKNIVINIQDIRAAMVGLTDIFTETDITELDASIAAKVVEVDAAMVEIKALIAAE